LKFWILSEQFLKIRAKRLPSINQPALPSLLLRAGELNRAVWGTIRASDLGIGLSCKPDASFFICSDSKLAFGSQPHDYVFLRWCCMKLPKQQNVTFIAR
jgi:hypothetical protein